LPFHLRALSAREIDLLVRAEFLYPVMDGMPVIAGGEVAIAGDRIIHAGAQLLDGSWQARQTVAGAGMAVLPGFVNCHCHTASIVFRSQTDDYASKAALLDVAFRMDGRQRGRMVPARGSRLRRHAAGERHDAQ
jgi:5-methylthioadenosine/S-adenosylhomocysteine deaminase